MCLPKPIFYNFRNTKMIPYQIKDLDINDNYTIDTNGIVVNKTTSQILRGSVHNGYRYVSIKDQTGKLKHANP